MWKFSKYDPRWEKNAINNWGLWTIVNWKSVRVIDVEDQIKNKIMKVGFSMPDDDVFQITEGKIAWLPDSFKERIEIMSWDKSDKEYESDKKYAEQTVYLWYLMSEKIKKYMTSIDFWTDERLANKKNLRQEFLLSLGTPTNCLSFWDKLKEILWSELSGLDTYVGSDALNTACLSIFEDKDIIFTDTPKPAPLWKLKILPKE